MIFNKKIAVCILSVFLQIDGKWMDGSLWIYYIDGLLTL
jgi:hypothetical protein